MYYSDYNDLWYGICVARGYDFYECDASSVWDELSEEERTLLESLWDPRYDN